MKYLKDKRLDQGLRERGEGVDNDPGADGCLGAHELKRRPIQTTLRGERPIEVACEQVDFGRIKR